MSFHRDGTVQLNVLNPISEEQHNYEDLEQYSKDPPPQVPPTKPAAQSSLPAASGGDYEITTCPAYVPVTPQGQSSVLDVKGTEEGQYEVMVIS